LSFPTRKLSLVNLIVMTWWRFTIGEVEEEVIVEMVDMELLDAIAGTKKSENKKDRKIERNAPTLVFRALIPCKSYKRCFKIFSTLKNPKILCNIYASLLQITCLLLTIDFNRYYKYLLLRYYNFVGSCHYYNWDKYHILSKGSCEALTWQSLNINFWCVGHILIWISCI